MQSPRKAPKYGSLTKSVGIFYQNGYIYFGGRQTNYIKSKFSKGKSRTVSEYIDVIARLDGETFKWSLLGKLNTKRSDHGIIQVRNDFLVVGGAGKLMTERCTFISTKTMSCKNQKPELTDFKNRPSLFIVDIKFCS